ncbi:hypothetical protein NPIL_431511 [Nephila pilipes]|uniref:Uncharacterized protein n=1 Tax=Nephila pilipes TaxID=299642 RepID=A0A8X6NYS8_NEPPI|nr:hypothetical protein NPIL_431511 [Nephila pilipes]
MYDEEGKKRNQTCKRSKGLRIVRFVKNRAFHEVIKCTPHEALLGKPLKVELESYSFPNISIENVRNEEELQALIETVNTFEKTNCEMEDDSDEGNLKLIWGHRKRIKK